MTPTPTTSFTPATCATVMRAAAKRYDQDGRATADRAHALALPASATPDVHVASSGTSDPTPGQAMQRPSEYAQYVDRWAKVTASLDGLVGAPLARNLRSVASIIEKSPRRFQQTTINRLGPCAPMTMRPPMSAVRDGPETRLSVRGICPAPNAARTRSNASS